MPERSPSILVLGAFLFITLLSACHGNFVPCNRVDCSGHGECVEEDDRTWCNCDPGYYPAGHECLPGSEPDGDSDSPADGDIDGDIDVDSDVDSDGDADGDSDGDGDGDGEVESCGDGTCHEGETAATCPGDCPMSCGDEACTHTEDAESCYDDCGICGDDICTAGSENACFCPDDCDTCGDGECTSREVLHESCPADCRGPGTFITLCAATFRMGSPLGEVGRAFVGETPHDATLTRDFEIQSTEVVQDEYDVMMDHNPSHFDSCDRCPVENVTWHDAAAYCNALSESVGLDACYECVWRGPAVVCELSDTYETPYDCLGYRLPTEAEWEFAARAGTASATYHGNLDLSRLACEQPLPALDDIAWFCGNASVMTHPVGTLDPNDWGLYDMLGNVREWCHDWHFLLYLDPREDPWGPLTGTDRVLRGGSFYDHAQSVRAAARLNAPPVPGELNNNDIGFRPARTLPGSR